MKTIFLSASVPYEHRHPRYFETADVIAIRDAVRALATVVVPNGRLVWGGHPAITPLIHYVLGRMNAPVRRHVTLYQSEFFREHFPPENEWFEEVVIVPSNADRDRSLFDMRNRMFADHQYHAGVFIGGMEGVEDEFRLFREYHRDAAMLPVASTGAAARIIYDRMPREAEPRLLNDYAYMALFTDLLGLDEE